MTIEKKLLGTNPSGGAVNVADVFSAYLYKGTSSAHTITNGIDLAGEGGMVWIKDRSTSKSNAVFDTERGATKRVQTDKTQAEITSSTALTSFNYNGFTVQDTVANESPDNFVSWTFRKAPKFFDVVTYTGNGASDRQIAHGLDGAVGMTIVKSTSGATGWFVFHRSNGVSPEDNILRLDTTAASADNFTYWNDTAPTSTVFTVGSSNNTNGVTYVAYLFADNSAEDAEEQMIKCGSYTTSSDANQDATINLGWEPQFFYQKRTDAASDHNIFDSMRGFGADEGVRLIPNTTGTESTANSIGVTSTGAYVHDAGASRTYVYMAIRAPMMKEPEAATEVFAVDNPTADQPWFEGDFPVDMAFFKDVNSTQDMWLSSRLTQGKYLIPSRTVAEVTNASSAFDYNNGWYANSGINTSYVSWMWKRAKGYFDVVAYTGNGPSNRYVNHSLGVVPEMIWVKNRGATYGWPVYHKTLTAYKYLYLESDADAGTNDFAWGNIEPTETQFHVDNNANGAADVNASGNNYVAYLFATLAGVSKVGSYTGNGNSQTIDCGFAAGARFILIKRYDTVSTGDWYIWDTTRGIVAGNDPHLSLNTTAAQVTSDDSIDPDNSGFIVNQVSATNINVNSASYIFYAIA